MNSMVNVVAKKIEALFRKGKYSPKMVALMGFILGQKWTSPAIAELVVTGDNHVLARNEGEAGADHYIGSFADFKLNVERVMADAGLTPAAKALVMHRMNRVATVERSGWSRRGSAFKLNPGSSGGWFAVVSVGTKYKGPRGPFRSREEADEAVRRWSAREGYLGGSILAAASVRVYGPYATRRAAKRADISQMPRRNPGISNWAGGPEHTWVYPGNVRVRAGDVIRYRSYNGMGRTGPEYVPAEGKVHLIGPAGAVVGSRRGGMPVVVTDETFVALVRKPR